MTVLLTDFQDDFAKALFASGGEVPARLARIVRQPGFAVYRNTVIKGCIDALQANFPTVSRLVGGSWFRAAAGVYLQSERPSDPRMLHYGDRFPEFLAGFEPASELPYLSGVALLDRFWSEAHGARDEPALLPSDLATLAPDVLGDVVLPPHSSARWKWFTDLPVYTIWRRNREESSDDSDIAWDGEGALLVRQDAVVAWMPASAADCAFLDACQDGQKLTDAAAAALAVDASVDLAQLLARLLAAGAFAASAVRISY